MKTPRRNGGRTLTRLEKVRWIFERFDVNGDGGLNRSEMAAFVSAVNSAIHFTANQISSVIDEVFRSYSDYIPDPSAGLSLSGLVQTYADGAGDLDRDFAVLSISQQNRIACDPLASPARSLKLAPAWISSPNHGVTRDSTWKVIEDLEIAIRSKIKVSKSSKDSSFVDGSSHTGWSTDLGMEMVLKGGFILKENSTEFRVLLQELKEIRAHINRFPMAEEAFDGHLAVGRTLFERRFFLQALESFRRTAELQPADVRPHYRMGNTLWCLGRLKEAKESFMMALKLAEEDSLKWTGLLPQIHVNLGIVMEGEGLVINASEHYREASILYPSHYRALKLLGSALFGIGQYKAAEKALQEAVFLNPNFPDAHCDLGCVFHAMGEEEKAILSFQRAIDLKSDHLDSLYNLGSLFLNAGRHQRAAEMFGRVVAISPDHWKAQLNKGISLFGAGELHEAKKVLSGASKITNRVELYEAIWYLKKQSRRKSKEKNGDWVAVDPSKFKKADERTTDHKCLLDALSIREIQRATKLWRCDAILLKKEKESFQLPVSRLVRKAEVEVLLHKLLDFLQPDSFREVMKTIDEKIWSVLDSSGSGKIDVVMFFAVIAPICRGPPDNRKRTAFEVLSWRSANNELQNHVSKKDAAVYMRKLRLIYLPFQSFIDNLEDQEEEDMGISLHEFVKMFDDVDHGFSIINTLLKLERGEREHRSRHSCGVCRYKICNIMFKEMRARFSLCANCYSECKVPLAFEREEVFKFKECLLE